MPSLSYLAGEAGLSLRRGGASNVLAIVTISLALFVFGAFLLVTSTLDRLMAGWGRSAAISIYLQDDVTDDQRGAIEAALDGNGAIERRDFVSKQEAARRFRRDFPDLASAAAGLATNPLPASYEVRLRAKDIAGADLDHLARTVAQMPGVADVRYDRQWLDRLARVVGAIRWIGLALAAALALAAGLTVAAVVRLGMIGRKDEVEIMALVGAPFGAIRGPFVVEGVVQGGLGAVVALVALRAGYEVARVRLAASLGSIDPSVIRFLSPLGALAIVGVGVVVGCAGGWIATRGVR